MAETVEDRYRRRADDVERRVAAVAPGMWSAPSPCARWSVRDVVAHIVEMHAVMLRGTGRQPGPAPTVAEDPLGALRAARRDVEALLADEAASAREVDTPGGRMTLAEHVDGVLSDDIVLHGWDLARATGQDDTIDATDLVLLWDTLRAIPPDVMERYRTPGAFGPGVEVFGPEVEVGRDAPLQARVLGCIGRDPRWTAPA